MIVLGLAFILMHKIKLMAEFILCLELLSENMKGHFVFTELRNTYLLMEYL